MVIKTPSPVQSLKPAKGRVTSTNFIIVIKEDEDEPKTLHYNFFSQISNNSKCPLEYDSEEYLSNKIPYEMELHGKYIFDDK